MVSEHGGMVSLFTVLHLFRGIADEDEMGRLMPEPAQVKAILPERPIPMRLASRPPSLDTLPIKMATVPYGIPAKTIQQRCSAQPH